MLKKLSLAALIAMGTMSVASAAPLSQAIKNVNFGGYLRLRIYNDKASGSSAVNKYRTTALFKFSVPVSEELKFNTAYAFDWNIKSDGSVTQTTDSAGDTTNVVAPAPGNVKFFLQYSANGLTALVGKIPVPTPVTATGVGEATAAGAIALYKVSDNLTLAAAGLDAMVGTDKVTVGGNNTYAAAALYNQDNLSAQAWYFKVDKVIDSEFVVRANYKMDGIALHADYAQSDLASATDLIATQGSTTVNSLLAAGLKSNNTQTYFNVSAKYAQDGMCAKVGFVKTGSNGGVVVLDGDSPLASVLPTPQKTGIANTVDDHAYYAKLGYKVDPKTNVYLAYADADKSFDNELAVGGSYQYTKKMKISAYYSIGSNVVKDSKGNLVDNNQARVEFKYSF